MKALKLKKAVFALTFLALGTLAGSALSSPSQVGRLDFFDAQDNSLLYVTFEYQNGKNTAYTVFFSDSTFTRRVLVTQNDAGITTKETSVNFTSDTIFNATFTPNGDKTDVTLFDQFKIDQFGGKVTYGKAGENTYNFSQNGAQINQMKYKYDTNGKLSRVDIYDNTGATLLYYGLFDIYTGVLPPKGSSGRSVPRPSFALKGANALAWNFTIDHAASVKCEAMTVAGRRLAVLFDGNLPAGIHSKTIRMGKIASMTNGVYLIRMSVDDKPVATDKFIVQSIRGGSR